MNALVEPEKKSSPVLGVLRLDYDYPPILGDVDQPNSFEYDVLYRAVPGLTFEICQSGDIPAEVQQNCIEAVRFLNGKSVSGITSDCGFMVHLQSLVRLHTDKPVFLSCLMQLPLIIGSIDPANDVAIFTANSNSLETIELELDRMGGLEEHSHRLRIIGCQDVPGFDAVATGGKVDPELVGPGVQKLAEDTLQKYPNVEAILLECTELPHYANALRRATGLPVYDSVTNCNSFMSGFQSSKVFGLQGWQKEWSGTHQDYHLGDNLTDRDRTRMKNLNSG